METEAGGIISANAAYWNSRAARWRDLDLPSPDELRTVVAQLGSEPGSLVLDAGCGAGQWSVALALVGHRIHGIDISPEMIAASRDRATSHAIADDVASFRVGSLDATGLPDASIDAILCRLALDF